MPISDRSDLPDLAAFSAIVRRRSIKAAAIELGVTSSALSHTMRRLEARLGLRLLNRTNRSLSPTEAGALLAIRVDAGLAQIDQAIGEIEGLRNEAVGDLRINLSQDASHCLLRPALPEFARRHPQSKLTIVVENRPIDIVAEGFDAGVRFGDNVPEDMVAVALTKPLEWVLVASPTYIEHHGAPENPQDLARHRNIRLLLGDNSVFAWELGNDDEMVSVRTAGPLTINDTQTTIDAACSGLGIAYVLRRRVERHLESDELLVVLPEWASVGAAFHMYYPSRRHTHPTLRNLINVVRNLNGLAPINVSMLLPPNDRTGSDGLSGGDELAR